MWEAVRVARTTSAICIVILLFVALVGMAHAELLHYDPFLIGMNPSAGEYTPGQLVGQNPTIGPAFPSFLSGAWTTGSFGSPPTGHVVQDVSVFGSYYPWPGGSVRANIQFDGARTYRFLTNPWNDSTTGTFYLSFFVNFGTSADPTDGMGFRGVEFWKPDGTAGSTGSEALVMGYSEFFTFGMPSDPDLARMAVRIGGAVQVLPDAPNSFNEDGLAHFVVMKFDLSPDLGSDIVSVYLDPEVFIAIPDSRVTADWGDWPEIVPSAVFSDIDFTLGAIGPASLFGGTGRGTEFDEIRIGTEFEDVIPLIAPPGPCSGPELGEACYLAIIHEMNSIGLHPEGDLNNDGRVDLYDLRLWRDNRTDIYGFPGIVGVPEPNGLVLMLVTLVPSLSRKRPLAA